MKVRVSVFYMHNGNGSLNTVLSHGQFRELVSREAFAVGCQPYPCCLSAHADSYIIFSSYGCARYRRTRIGKQRARAFYIGSISTCARYELIIVEHSAGRTTVAHFRFPFLRVVFPRFLDPEYFQ